MMRFEIIIKNEDDELSPTIIIHTGDRFSSLGELIKRLEINKDSPAPNNTPLRPDHHAQHPVEETFPVVKPGEGKAGKPVNNPWIQDWRRKREDDD